MCVILWDESPGGTAAWACGWATMARAGADPAWARAADAGARADGAGVEAGVTRIRARPTRTEAAAAGAQARLAYVWAAAAQIKAGAAHAAWNASADSRIEHRPGPFEPDRSGRFEEGSQAFRIPQQTVRHVQRVDQILVEQLAVPHHLAADGFHGETTASAPLVQPERGVAAGAGEHRQPATLEARRKLTMGSLGPSPPCHRHVACM